MCTHIHTYILIIIGYTDRAILKGLACLQTVLVRAVSLEDCFAAFAHNVAQQWQMLSLRPTNGGVQTIMGG